MVELETIVSSIAAGSIAGCVYSVAGFFNTKKNKLKEGKEISFDPKVFFTTVVGSAIVGGIAGYMGLPFDIVMTGSIGVAVTQLVKKVWNTLLG